MTAKTLIQVLKKEQAKKNYFSRALKLNPNHKFADDQLGKLSGEK